MQQYYSVSNILPQLSGTITLGRNGVWPYLLLDSCPCSSLSSHARSRRSLIVLQTNQHLPHSLLAAPLSTTELSLPTQINELRNPLPTGAARSRVLSLCQELLCLLLDLRFLSVCFPVVGFVEAVNVFLSCSDGLVLLLLRGFVTAVDIGVALLAPGADGFGVCLVGLRSVVRVRVGVGDGTAGADGL